MICKVCKTEKDLLCKNLGVCYSCLVKENESALEIAKKLHIKHREIYNLPSEPPKEESGISCNWCFNNCMVLKNKSYCGLVSNNNGKIKRLAGIKTGLASWYYDPLPTNCVGDWVCPAGSSCGYPKYSTNKGPEYGYKNLAVFYGSCTFDCLFCQNSQYKDYLVNRGPLISAKDLASKVDDKVNCICYFGGDPSSQAIHSINTSRIALKRVEKRNKILRICWETNGNNNEKIMKKMIEIALNSGGCIKIDLKCYTESLNIALCGVSNKQTLKNFKNIGKIFDARFEVPLLIASSLLIPGYIDTQEINLITQFISEINPNIPYRLLGFYPHHLMTDLPRTSKFHAERCLKIAKENGLKEVSLGNLSLLSQNKYGPPIIE